MIYKPEEAPIEETISSCGLVKRRRGQRKKRNERELLNIVTAFDIETSTVVLPKEPDDKRKSVNAHAFMYVWQWQIGKDITVVGRTWEQFREVVARIKSACAAIKEERKLELSPLLITYVHNLAFEFSFLSDPDIYDFKTEDCFFRAARKPIYARMENCIEFRCSYIQSNMTLAKFAENMGCTTRKLDGQLFDYRKIRYPWTPLTDYELQYCINDVISLEEAIRLEMERDGDNLRTIPYTSTGYVRRDCKAALYPCRKWINEMLPDGEQYRLLRKAFRGGNTHASRYYAGQIVQNVESYDMSSCYPAQQLTKEFPMSAFKWLDDCDLTRVLAAIKRGKAVVGEYVLKGLRLKNMQEPIPYISLARCEVLHDNRPESAKRKRAGTYKRQSIKGACSYAGVWNNLHVWGRSKVDNGRVLRAPMVKIALTEIDLKIVLNQYTYSSMAVQKAMIATKGMLPDYYRKVIQDYYDKKTSLKNVEGAEYEYMKSKNKLNSVYGMSAQDVGRAMWKYHQNGIEEYTQEKLEGEKLEEALQKASFPYQWGVYTTAYAREALQEAIDKASSGGAENHGIMVYCDTDSIKTEGTLNFDEINKKRVWLAKKNKAGCADRHGVMHYPGVYERETPYTRFITQGAKRYAYEQDIKGLQRIGVTVSGVTHVKNPDTGNPYCVEELGSLENFVPGMVWEKAGGTDAIYNDADDFEYTDPETGRAVHIGKNVALVDSTYTLKYGEDYAELLKTIILWRDYRRERE